jgi:D-arabinose 1-dehydrogenase-like Zn-dependent alcohol dehydrogenase
MPRVGDARFVFKIPEAMTNSVACTFFCAGATTYGLLKRRGVTEGSVVGVMGVKVVAMSHVNYKWPKSWGQTSFW